MEKPSKFLLVIGILMLIFNTIFLAIIAFVAFLVGFIEPGLEALSYFILFIFPWIIFFVLLLACILGMVNRNKSKMGVCCLFIGATLFIFHLVYFALLILIQLWVVNFTIFLLILNNILPAFYIKAAYLVKKQGLA